MSGAERARFDARMSWSDADWEMFEDLWRRFMHEKYSYMTKQGAGELFSAATAAAKATITAGVCREAYERGVAEERAALQPLLDACAAMLGSLHIREPSPGRFEISEPHPKVIQEFMQAYASAIRARTPSPAEEE